MTSIPTSTPRRAVVVLVASLVLLVAVAVAAWVWPARPPTADLVGPASPAAMEQTPSPG